ncbi:MAG: hypothetical protein ACREX3_10125 [Gammaproteobacteria bacterium]
MPSWWGSSPGLGSFIEGGADGKWGDARVDGVAAEEGIWVGKKVKEKVEIVLPMGRRKLKIEEVVTMHDLAESRLSSGVQTEWLREQAP